MPVYNGMPYLREALDSILTQDLDPTRFELIVVDDGSTDGGLQVLREYAATFANCTLIELEHTGSPAAPRNVGIDHARGRYILFFDADDLLASYALSDMVAVADANDVDIVVPKQRALGGRSVPIKAFRTTLPKTDIYRADVYRILGPVKLFRTSFISDNRLRFPEGFPRKSDVPFGVESYLAARSISVLADKDYVTVRLRDDGGNLTTNRTALRDHMPVVRFVFETVPSHVAPGRQRDQLMTRHFRTELVKAIFEGFPAEQDEEYRRDCYELFVGFARQFCTKRVLRALPVRERVIAYLLLQDRYHDLCALAEAMARLTQTKAVLRRGTLFLTFPGYRDPKLRIPDEVYRVGVNSCVQASVSDAAVDEDDLTLSFICRILVTNSPVSDVEVLLDSTVSRDRVPVARIDDFTEVCADVRQIEFTMTARQFTDALGASSDGRWAVVVRLVLGDLPLEAPVQYMDSARRGVGSSPTGFKKANDGRFVVILGALGRIARFRGRMYAVCSRVTRAAVRRVRRL